MSSTQDQPSLQETSNARQESGPYFSLKQRIVAGLMLSTLATACSQADVPAESPSNTLAPTSRPTPQETDPLKIYESPYGACDEASSQWLPEGSQAYEKALAEDAAECMDLYKNSSSVAVINYALSPEDAETMAAEIATRVTSSTLGLITLNLTVIPPSSKAIELFKEQNPEDCIDNEDLWSSGSYIASATMPELDNYDKIIALNDVGLCKPEAEGGGGGGGVAYSVYARYGEVFETDTLWQSIEGNGGSNLIEGQEREGMTVTTLLADPADVAAHELLHLYGLGHAGTMFNNATNIQGLALGGSKEYAMVDFRDYVEQGVYIEYGEDSVMGEVTGLSDDTPLNIALRYALEWPHRTLAEPTTINSIDVESSTRMDANTPKNSIAIITLDKPLDLPKGKDGSKTDFGQSQIFNEVAFVPLFNDQQADRVWAVETYLISDGNSTVSLGTLYIYNDSGRGKYDFLIDDQTIVLEFDPQGVNLGISTIPRSKLA